MKNYIRSIARSWKHHFTLQLATFTVMTASLFTVTVFTSAYLNLESILTLWGENLQMTVFLNPEISPEEIDDLREFITADKGVSQAKYVSSELGAAQFQEQVGSYAPDLFNDEELRGLVPPSFEITLADTIMAANPMAFMKEFATQITQIAGVEDVSYGQEWVNRYVSILSSITYVGSFLIFILLSACLFVTGNSIRVALHQRREEIEILELIGATKSMIRRPFIVEGAFLGFLSSTIAVSTSAFMFWMSKEAFSGKIVFMGLKDHLLFMPIAYCFGFIFLGTLIGGVGALLCVRQLNGGWSASQRAELK